MTKTTMAFKIPKLELKLVRENCKSYKIGSSTKVKEMAEIVLKDLAEEKMIMFVLDSELQVVSYFEISHGTLTSSLVSVPAIFKRLLLTGYEKFIIAHNHPSGNEEPSKADLETTVKIAKAALILGVTFVDHVIITRNEYYSFVEHDLL